VFAATGGFWQAATGVPQPRTNSPALDYTAVAALIAHPESPFGTTSFADDRGRAALRSLLATSYLSSSGPFGREQRDRLAQALEAMVAAWPYRNLYVRPPELRRQALS
jgi:hypothetical protein